MKAAKAVLITLGVVALFAFIFMFFGVIVNVLVGVGILALIGGGIYMLASPKKRDPHKVIADVKKQLDRK